MKITKEHYSHMKQAIACVWTKEKHDAHRAFIVNEGKSNDVERRLRFDWMYYAGLNKFICNDIYAYANDEHINTALKNIVSEISDAT